MYCSLKSHLHDRIWKNMSLDDTLTDDQRAELAVWDYPVSDKYTKIWWTMQEASLPLTFEEGVARVKNSQGSDGFAFIGKRNNYFKHYLRICIYS